MAIQFTSLTTLTLEENLAASAIIYVAQAQPQNPKTPKMRQNFVPVL